MPRSPARSTLKLPAKPSEATDPRLPQRKPIRSGVLAAKPSVAQRAREQAEKAERAERKPFRTDDRRPAAARPNTPPALAPRQAGKTDAPAIPREAPRRPKAPPPPPAKVYPKRGIARSTGARALPPARMERETSGLQPVELQNSAPVVVAVPERQAAQASTPVSEPTPVRRPLKEPPRLSKRITEMTQCSRREADEWIENGWVRVDGEVVTTLGTRAHPNAKIEIREDAGKHQTESVTILFNKPLDAEPATSDDELASPSSLIRSDNRWAEDESRRPFKATHLRGLAQVGKLDAESTGMLVFTQEGSVARRITGDETRLEKEYMVRVEGVLSAEDLKRLNLGLTLDEIKLKRAQVSWQNEQQLRFVLHESRKNQIRRMCELVGLRVVSIKRIRIGSVSLGKLPAGEWRYLRANERF